MHRPRPCRYRVLAALVTALIAAPILASGPAGLHFALTYDESVTDAYSGRVYVMLSRSDREPRLGPSWFRPDPFFALDVQGWQPGERLIIDESAPGFPADLRELTAGTYTVQAVMRLSLDSPFIGRGAGNAYSRPRRLALDPRRAEAVELHVDRLVQPQTFRESDRIRLVSMTSRHLSEFHGRPITLRAAVVLPEGFDRDARYPAYYWINGFGSDHHGAHWLARMWAGTGYGDRIVRVVPDPLCLGGHHVFADSDSNGPYGTALVEELIPLLESRFPVVPAPTARFLGGHSSGGWSSLWLQVTHPDVFGGVWSVAPDPVDFRDFQRIDLYEPGVSMYRTADGRRRPIARQGEQVMLWYDDFVAMETVHGEGGQIRSFEWVFSPRGPDGLPLPLFDRATGIVDPAVARAWRRYDISLILREGWDRLGPKLDGKLNVFMGGMDTFYLDGATRLLQKTLAEVGSDAVIEIVPDADHGSISTPALQKRIDREMLEIFDAHHPAVSSPGS